MTQTISPSLTSLIQKYNLDISIVEIKNLGVGNRLDTDFYKPEHLATERLTQTIHFCSFKDLGIQVDASAFYPSIEPRYNTGSLPFLRVANVDTSIKYDEAVTIPEELPSIYTTIKIGKPGDVVITKGGTVARCGILDRDCALSRDLILVPSSHLTTIQQKALFIYLISSTSNKLLLKTASLTAQPHLTLKLIQEHPIFIPKGGFIEKISEIFDEYTENRELSKSLYTEAENILLRELGLVDWQPSEANITEKMSEEVELFGRCDAEFFQPKYDEILEKIKNYKGGYNTIENLILIASKQMKIEDGRRYQYCELADIEADLGIVRNFTEILGSDLPSRARMKIEKGDVVVSSVAGSAEKVALIQNQDDNLVASTGFFILKPKAFNAETNLVLMKSSFMKMFLERSARGMILSATNQEDFKNLIIPNISPSIQSLISEKIIASHSARENSKKLLEKAKRAVEIFIEEDEGKAENYINS